MARILPQLVDEILVEEEAKKLGVKVYDQEVEAALDRICQQNHMTRKELDARMRQEGLSLEKYKKDLKKQIIRTRIINANVQSKIVITDEQVMKFIGKESSGASYEGPYYTLDHICILPDDPDSEASREKAFKKAQQALAALKAGKDFAEVAREYSDLPSKEQGGRLGVFSMDEMAPFVRKNVSGLARGEFSGVIDTPAGYQIFRVADVSSTHTVNISPEKMEEIREKLYRIEINEKFEEWLQNLRKKATIKILL
jgi:peptidyl-prolyl cis-trans isomerase SurA